jgi:hypothetical protein
MQCFIFLILIQLNSSENTPIVPPPFTPLVHLFQLARYLKRRFCCKGPNVEPFKSDSMDFAISLHFSLDQCKNNQVFRSEFGL